MPAIGNFDTHSNITNEYEIAAGKATATELINEQKDSDKALVTDLEETVNPFAAKKEEKLKDRKETMRKNVKPGEKPSAFLAIERIKNSSEQFQRRNPELKATTLQALREKIKPSDTKEDIIKKIREIYAHPALAAEALEFLMETTEGDLNNEVKEAQILFMAEFKKEITAGKNIALQAQEASDKGLGTATDLRGLYDEVTKEAPDSNALFEKLSTLYAFKDLKKVIDFLLHSLGADMKSKGPSIPRGQLHTLFTETRSLQAILGVYRFFRGRMNLVEKLFEKEG